MLSRLIRIKIRDIGLLGEGYFTQSKNKLGNIIILDGLPSYLHTNLLGLNLCKAGYNVIQPFYYGSWASDREFSIKNCFQTLTDTIKALKENQIWDIYNDQVIKTNQLEINLVGISFGSNIIMSYDGNHQDYQKAVFISPIPTFPNYNSNFGFNSNQFVDFLDKAFKNCYRFKNNLEMIQIFSDQNSLLNQIHIPFDKLILALAGENDYVPNKLIEKFYTQNKFNYQLEVVEGGHGINKLDQELLTQKIINFL